MKVKKDLLISCFVDTKNKIIYDCLVKAMLPEYSLFSNEIKIGNVILDITKLCLIKSNSYSKDFSYTIEAQAIDYYPNCNITNMFDLNLLEKYLSEHEFSYSFYEASNFRGDPRDKLVFCNLYTTPIF